LKTGLLVLLATGAALAQQIPAPRIWNDRDLAEWATPLATLKVRPGHLTEQEYYSVAVGDWVRTYPVYFPGREPEGYMQMLQTKKPEPLIAAGPRTQAEWVEAGRRAFEEMDVPGFRTKDPKIIAKIRSAEAFYQAQWPSAKGRHYLRLAMGADGDGPDALDFGVLRLPHAVHAGWWQAIWSAGQRSGRRPVL
jgi:hypothetical protein